MGDHFSSSSRIVVTGCFSQNVQVSDGLRREGGRVGRSRKKRERRKRRDRAVGPLMMIYDEHCLSFDGKKS